MRMQKQEGEGRKSRKMGQMKVSLSDSVYDVVRCAPTARCAASPMYVTIGGRLRG